MFKKISVVTALSAALLFGGASVSTVDAQTNADQSDFQYKIYYSVNGGQWDNVSKDGLVSKVLNKINWNQFNQENNQADQKEQDNKEEVKQPEQKEEQPKQEQPKQEQQAKEEQPKQEQQAKEEQPKQEQQAKEEQPKQEQPAKEEQPKQEQPAQAEQPVEQAEAPVQQPVKEQEQPTQNNEQAQELSQFEQEVVELTNKEREKNGLAPLQIDTELSKVARVKSQDMSTNSYFAHNSPTYGSPFDMMKSFGIDYRTAGENLAKGQRTPQEVVDGWMNSEGHRANILNENYTHIGVGYVEQGNYWTQQFIGK